MSYICVNVRHSTIIKKNFNDNFITIFSINLTVVLKIYELVQQSTMPKRFGVCFYVINQNIISFKFEIVGTD